jgi:predicted Rossmann fold nucleotide-binding protein DprA/Smf involved in DNA uptake
VPKPVTLTRTIAIVGSRRRDGLADYNAVRAKFDELYKPGDRLVSGGCPKGADRFAEGIAKELGLTITIHYPDWSRGRNAGLERNATIVAWADVVIAAVAADRTGGTESTVRHAEAKRIPVHLV